MSQHESGAKGSGGRDEEARGDEREAEGRCSSYVGMCQEGCWSRGVWVWVGGVAAMPSVCPQGFPRIAKPQNKS